MPLKIMPHGRLQEWVAEEKGFFAAEGLDYTFVLDDSDYGIHTTRRDDAGEIKTGAFETFGAGRGGAAGGCAVPAGPPPRAAGWGGRQEGRYWQVPGRRAAGPDGHRPAPGAVQALSPAGRA